MDGKKFQIWHRVALVALAICVAPGCTAPSLFGKKDVSKELQPGQTFYVDFHRANGDVATVERPWSNDLHVQEAAKQAGGFRKFNRFDIELHRQLPQGGMHRMIVDYAKSTQRVEPEFDYVVHPGDRLVILEREETILDDAVNAVLEPFGLEHINKQRAKTKQGLPSKYRVEG